MIISRTPFRVSLFGGGTDYPAYYREHGGEVLGAAIDRYCWITLRRLPPFFAYRHRFVYSKIELVNKIDEIQHPVIREVLRLNGLPACGIEMHHDGDLPARSGMGSSSAFTVGLVNALSAFAGHRATRQALAQVATDVERERLHEHVGDQDQLWAAFGGFNRITFDCAGRYGISPIIMGAARQEALNDSLMLFFTGFSRMASEIAGEQLKNFAKRQKQLRELHGMVLDARKVLEGSYDLDDLGSLLDIGWRLKRELAAGVSTSEIDEIYVAGRNAGALGGKLLGAGGGGFMVFYVPPQKQAAVRAALPQLIEVKIKLGAKGSEIVLYEPEI